MILFHTCHLFAFRNEDKISPPCIKIIDDTIKTFFELWVLEKVKGFLL